MRVAVGLYEFSDLLGSPSRRPLRFAQTCHSERSEESHTEQSECILQSVGTALAAVRLRVAEVVAPYKSAQICHSER